MGAYGPRERGSPLISDGNPAAGHEFSLCGGRGPRAAQRPPTIRAISPGSGGCQSSGPAASSTQSRATSRRATKAAATIPGDRAAEVQQPEALIAAPPRDLWPSDPLDDDHRGPPGPRPNGQPRRREARPDPGQDRRPSRDQGGQHEADDDSHGGDGPGREIHRGDSLRVAGSTEKGFGLAVIAQFERPVRGHAGAQGRGDDLGARERDHRPKVPVDDQLARGQPEAGRQDAVIRAG